MSQAATCRSERRVPRVVLPRFPFLKPMSCYSSWSFLIVASCHEGQAAKPGCWCRQLAGCAFTDKKQHRAASHEVAKVRIAREDLRPVSMLTWDLVPTHRGRLRCGPRPDSVTMLSTPLPAAHVWHPASGADCCRLYCLCLSAWTGTWSPGGGGSTPGLGSRWAPASMQVGQEAGPRVLHCVRCTADH